MKKLTVAALSLACFLVMVGQASTEPRPASKNMAKRLVLMQQLTRDIVTSDFDKAMADAKALADGVGKNTQDLSSGMKDADTTLEKSIMTFIHAAEKKSPLMMSSSYADILGNCYGCHAVYKGSK